MSGILRASLLPTTLLLAAPLARAQIVAQCGDDLDAIAAAAPDGSVIEIHGSCAFVGTISFSGKSLTFRAAPGSSPVLQGDPGRPLFEAVLAGGVTSVAFEDLLIVRGDAVFTSTYPYLLVPAAMSFVGGGTNPIPDALAVRGCRVVGRVAFGGASLYSVLAALEGSDFADRVELGGTGSVRFEVAAEGCTFSGGLDAGGTGSATIVVDVVECAFPGGLSAGGTGSAATTTLGVTRSDLGFVQIGGTGDHQVVASLSDGEIDGDVYVTGTGQLQVDLELARMRVHGRVFVHPISGAAFALRAESCLITPGADATGTGVAIDNAAVAELVNVTVAGFAVGIESNAVSTWTNMLLFDNGDDLAPGFPAGLITSSLIEDGTFAGVAGNLGGTPFVDDAFALVPGSLGVDAGDPLAPGLGALDLYGDPRVQDGDGDGVPEVNVGAVESLGGAAATAAVFNGSGVNPVAYLPAGAPQVGASFGASIALQPQTTATLLVVGAGVLATPYTDPAIAGEVLIQGPILLVDAGFAPGVHVIAIPALPALYGLELATQGFRVDALSVVALNGLALTLGT